MMSEHERAERRLKIAEKIYAAAVFDFYRTSTDPKLALSAGEYNFFGVDVILHAIASHKL